MNEDDIPLTLAQLPDNPLQMPPPYWRSGGSIFHIEKSMLEISENLLPRFKAAKSNWLAVADRVTFSGLDSDDYDAADDPLELQELEDVEDEIARHADIAILMAAIEIENAINMFSVYNLHKDAAEAIEKLSLTDRLILITALIGAPPIKGTAVYESTRRLVSWRNATAHGHCVDRPTGSLRKNHLIKPQSYPDVASHINDIVTYISDYLRVREYLSSISLNDYTSGRLVHDDQIDIALNVVKEYKRQ